MRSIFKKSLVAGLAVTFGMAAGCGGGGGDSSSSASDAGATAGSFKVGDHQKDPVATDGKGRYVYGVVLRQDPAVAYKGGIAGFEKTGAERGQRFNAKSAAVAPYRNFLKSQQNNLMKSVGVERAIYNYTVAVNGFAALMTPEQADSLRNNPQVRSVARDRFYRVNTSTSPQFIESFRAKKGLGAAGFDGEGVVVGVLDSGVWPEHPSFADDGTMPPPPDSWAWEVNEEGTCQFGNTDYNPDDVPFECNNKLIASYAFIDTYRALIPFPPGEFDSARDADGHGTHVLSTAAGNAGVTGTQDGESVGVLAGVAPRAHVVAYKSLIATTGGFSSDIAAAVDQGTFDGVDVFNFSFGSSGTNFDGPDDIAMLFANDAGVFIAASSGNSGPGASTIGTPAGLPWVMTVGNLQDDQVFFQKLGVSRPSSVAGAVQAIEGTSDVQLEDVGVIAGEMAIPANPANFEGCAPITNDMTGKIALISRGACAFTTKQANAEAAGAVMMYVYNNQPEGAVAMSIVGGTVPSFMVENSVGQKWLTAINQGIQSRASASETERKDNTMASSSSRGPNAGNPDILKPDISAPGTDITAGQTPASIEDDAVPGDLFQTISGTSMASPHVAGVAALLLQKYPDLTPDQLKSTMMTRSYKHIKDTFDGPATPHDYGAGRVRAFKVNPGLTTETDFFGYLAALCGMEEQQGIVGEGTCAFLADSGYSLDPSDLNVSSLSNSAVFSTWTTTRTFKSTANNTQTYTTRFIRPPNFGVQVNPSVFTVGPGESVDIQFTFIAKAAAADGEWRYGSVNFQNGRGNLQGRLPIAIKAGNFSSPEGVLVEGAGADGSTNYDLRFGFDAEEFAVVGNGLVPSVRQESEIEDDPTNDFDTAMETGVGAQSFPLPVPEGTLLLRVALFDDFTSAESDDLDLFLFDGDGNEVGNSLNGGSDEVIELTNPPAGDYTVWVHAFQTEGPTTVYTLFDWLVTEGGPGNLTVTGPTSATAGATEPVLVEWTGLAPAEIYLGVNQHNVITDTISTTMLEIHTAE